MLSFEETLKKLFKIDDKDLLKVYQLQKEFGTSLTQIFVKIGLLSEKQILQALSEYLKIPLIQENNLTIDKEVINFLKNGIDFDFLIKNNVVPIKIDKENNTLILLTNDPFNYDVINYLNSLLNCRIKLYLASEEIIKNLYKYFISESTSKSGSKENFVSLSPEDDPEKLKELAFEAPVIKYLNTLLNKAVELRASDIHIEPEENKSRVRLRIDGILHEMDILENTFHLAVVSRIKLLSGLDIAEKRLPQDGKFTTRIGPMFLDIRVSTIPTVKGEGVVLRLLYRERLYFDIKNLGLEEDHYSVMKKIISYPYGMILVTGPTGSGKTTTLYSILTYLNNDEKKIITIEDPVEYQLPGINQIQVKSEIGLTFASALRSILRHDPDIIMVGEIRDKETAEISIQSALTGHLVLSTLHTNNAPSSLFRLLDMGIEDYLINSSIVGIIAQRIVRKNCPYCSEEYKIDKEILKKFEIFELLEKFKPLLNDKIVFKKGKGCEKCAGTGYRGRIAIFEIFEYTEELKEIFKKTLSLSEIRKNIKKLPYYRTLKEDGFLKVLKGITTIDEILRVC
ncbi:MAG: Flp pilus assembly complex ATPase component TadA [Candidatus Desulfofervidus auxilii]|nr:Flp pilus assembly complex ATPase component TadA [Candidatus Desulfofervidus auxilii]